MTAYLYTAYACRALAVPATGTAAGLAATGHPWLALIPAWAALNLVIFAGLFHLGHRRQIAEQASVAHPEHAPALERTRP